MVRPNPFGSVLRCHPQRREKGWRSVKPKLATILVLAAALVLSMLATFSAPRPAAAAYDDPDDPKTVFPIDGGPHQLQRQRGRSSGTTSCSRPSVPTPLAPVRPSPPGRSACSTRPSTMPGLPMTRSPTASLHRQGDRALSDLVNKQKAISFAAYGTLSWLFPGRAGDYDLQMQRTRVRPD